MQTNPAYNICNNTVIQSSRPACSETNVTGEECGIAFREVNDLVPRVKRERILVQSQAVQLMQLVVVPIRVCKHEHIVRRTTKTMISALLTPSNDGITWMSRVLH